MDLRKLDQESHKHSEVETPRPPLVPAERNNEFSRRSRTREVSSRYRSPSPSAASGPRRCPSPNTRTVTTSVVSVPKRAISAERKRPATPPSPRSPSTPVHDTTKLMQSASSKLISSRLPDGLWPSTMRSLNVSFQSDTFSVPVSKREKPVTQALSDRSLRQSSNVAHKQSKTPPNVVHKQSKTPPTSRKPTPERKRSPLKGKNAPDQSENSKPVESLHGRLMDQHRWPSRIGGRTSSNASAKSIELVSRTSKTSTVSQGMAMPSLRREFMRGPLSTPLQKSASDVVRLMSSDVKGEAECDACSLDDNILKIPKVVSLGFSDRTKLVTPPSRPRSFPGSRPASPNKASLPSSSVSRCPSPARTALISAPSRGVSPSRSRPSSPSRQVNSSKSVLSYIADIRNGKKFASNIEDVHQLRLLYNRHLQWRYTNARANVKLNNQQLTAEKTLVNVWRTTSELWDSVIEKRIALEQLRLKLKLYSVLNEQMAYLDGWSILEKDQTSSVSGAIKDLQASTLRLPVTEGASANIDTLKAAVCSAADMLQRIGSCICSLLPKVEGTNSLVSELADVAAEERAMLDECEALLATTAATQVEEYSLRTHLIQLKQNWESGE